MAARRVVKKKPGRGAPGGDALVAGLERLERELPENLARLVRPLRRGLLDVERQLERARTEGERRWNRLERQIRRELAAWIRRLEKAVNPAKPPRKKTARRKAPRRKAA